MTSKVIGLVFHPPGRLVLLFEGHPSDVIEHAREIAQLVLGNKGPWRITFIGGNIRPKAYYDSEMRFRIIAEVKN